MDILSGETNVNIKFASFLKGVHSKGSKFFPFREDPFQLGVGVQGKQTGSHKSCFPCQKIMKIYHVHPVSLAQV